MILVLETSKNSGKKELVVNWHTALWLSQFHPNQFLTSHWACLEVFSIPCSTWMFFFSFGGILYIVFFPPETPYVHLGLWFTQISVFHRPDFWSFLVPQAGPSGRGEGWGGFFGRVFLGPCSSRAGQCLNVKIWDGSFQVDHHIIIFYSYSILHRSSAVSSHMVGCPLVVHVCFRSWFLVL